MTEFPGCTGISLCEPLIFEAGAPGRDGASLPPLDVPEVDPHVVLPTRLVRRAPAPFPELSEPEVVRHFTKISGWNLSIDQTFYPLGSCTMKYNPRINEWAAAQRGFTRLHPATPDALAQGALELMWRLERMLAEVCGMARVSLQPSAGAQGELTGISMIRAYHEARGNPRRRVLIPDTAHGTNPASCSLNGYTAEQVHSSDRGILDPESVAAAMSDDVAAIMVTNPNTLGLFESNLAAVAEIVHAKGGLVYGDGANMNSLMGKARPGDMGVDVMQLNLHKTFSTPHGGGGPGAGPVALVAALEPFMPVPTVEKREGGFALDYDRPASIGRLRAYHANFGVLVRAYAYMRELGGEGLTRVTELAVLNANYMLALLRDHFHVPHDRYCMHECVLSDKAIGKETEVGTTDIAKRLIDYGFHPPTVHFPLVVRGALMIEPTETETKQTLETFAAAMLAILEEARTQPDLVKNAPQRTARSRPDEALAARHPKLRWLPPER
jgi:glycine dehydrogenase subunit 2